ncbi:MULTISPECIES: L-fucose:H+ symporter permease [unclassified Leeuwenhoekiella]|uniref:L-fucose:H+ symporter permease n=1 Tax=unclassified Leeuwenhoekiella TaxID=2615029 RepID=UPI000C612F06|nr:MULTISPECIES: L-fucose:H+ symporter permease [unclassified Leeuwenhoekiella]MAW95417.1 L-fucose:H+ symporter permease [Leeuwenhoekiella sp.]MBA80804.1 L-fucose:H+ symporter permease [Leeuwenhoekiella sp.]|tara:strand:+ start:62837 stop:64153 length:1317 start_codon:yes stop_codon:yes gene_type:complete
MNTSNATPVVPKKLLFPFILVTSLFALWGFANAVTDPMVQAFKKVLELTNSQAAWVQMAFYGGYFCMALPAALFVRRYTYKSGILVGLTLYAVGALLFYPAATTGMFWFFCLGLYILTFGLAFLETTANPYILAMGDSKTATRRLNLSQAFNPVGLIAGLLVAKFFVLDLLQSDDVDDFSALDQTQKMLIKSADLMVIRNPYVILGLVVLAILVLIAINKMPQAKGEGATPSIKSTFATLFQNNRYTFGVLSLVLYMGAQIGCWTYIYQYAESKEISSSTAANYQLAAFVLFTLGRAVGTYLLKFLSPGKLLFYFACLGGLCTLGVIVLEANSGLICLVLVSLFLSIMFPTIYGIALDGLKEDQAKIGAAGLVMAIVGGALLPKIQGMIIDLGGAGVDDIKMMGLSEMNLSFILPLICFLSISIYGIWIHRKDAKLNS